MWILQLSFTTSKDGKVQEDKIVSFSEMVLLLPRVARTRNLAACSFVSHYIIVGDLENELLLRGYPVLGCQIATVWVCR